MLRRNYLTVLLYLAIFLVLGSNSQSVPLSSYSPMASYSSNSFFTLANSEFKKAYSSLLSQTTVSSVYVYNSNSLASLIVTYVDKSGREYRGTANYVPSTRQFSIASFGPVESKQSSSSTSVPYQLTIIGQENGIGMTSSQSPPKKETNLIPDSNPALGSQKITVLLPNSTSTTNSRSSYSSDDDDTGDYYTSSSRSSNRSSSSRSLRSLY